MVEKLSIIKNKITLNKFIEGLLVILAFIIPISRSGMNIFAFFIFILWLLKKIKNKSLFKGIDRLNLWLMVYIFILFLPLINFASKQSLFVMLDEFVSTYFKYIIIFIVTIEIIDNNKKFKKIMNSFYLSSAIVISYGMYEFLFKQYRGRLTSTYNNANTAGNYFMIVAVMAFCYLLFSENRRNKVISLIYFISSTTLLILTYSRGAWVGYISAIIFCLMIYVYNLKSNKLKFSVIVTFLIILILIVTMLPANVLNRFKSINDLESRSIKQRLIQYKVGFNMLKDYPIFGVGMGRFSEMFNEYKIEGAKSFRHIHNIYLDIAVETGLIGFVVLSLIVYKFIIKNIFVSINSNKKFELGFLMVFFGNLVHNSVDWTFLHSMVGLNLIVLAALWFNYKKGKYNKREDL